MSLKILNICIFCIIILSNVSYSSGQEITFERDSIRARQLIINASALGRNGMHIQALDTFRAALELRKKLYGEINYNLAVAYTGIGISYRELGRFNLALQNFELAEQNYALQPEKGVNQLPALYQRMGNVYRNKLDYNEALRYFNQALNLFKNDNNAQQEDVAAAYYHIAEIYYSTDDYTKVLEICNNQADKAYYEDKLLYTELQAYANQQMGNTVIARKHYHELIKLSEDFYHEDAIQLAYVYLNYVSFLMSVNLFDETIHYVDEALKIIQKVQPNKGKDLAYCYRIYGDLEKERNLNIKNIDEFTTNNRKKLLKAIQWYKKGLEALDYPEDISGSFTEFQFCASKIDCIELLKLIADSYFELQKNEQTEQSSYYREFLHNSLKYYNQAGDVIQQVRAEISGEESKIQLTELEKTTFHKSIQTAFLAYSTFQDDKYLNIAFQNSERTKSSAVFDQLNQQEAIDNSVIPDSILLKEKEINQKIAVYQQKILEEKNLNSPNNSLIEVYNSELFELNRTKQELMLLLETDFKDYYNLKYSNSMLTVTDIQKRLKKNEVLLEYVLEENEAIVELYTFIITPGNAIFLKQELEKSWLADIERVFRFTSSKEYQYVTGKQSVEFCLASYNLYKKLILPCQDFIKDKKLIIIPDGKINYVAFDALLTALPDTSQRIRFNELKYLVKDYCTNHGFSANLLYAFQGKKEKQKVKVKAFAPSYSGESYQFGNQEIKLTPLTGTIQEVDAISSMLNTEKFINEDATESNFRKHAADSEILHLAMHAYINDSIPALSRFAFAKPGDTMPQNDGWLTTIDIYNLELNCRMVVLSACNTGTGALRKGEGVMSLARGFLFAGCPSIVMTLWEVEDKSGAEIMHMFYRNIKKGKPKDEALRLSKLHFLENSNSRMAHPHYWLGFISIGDNSPLFRSYDFYFFGLVVLLILAIAADQFFRNKKSPRKQAKSITNQ